MGKNLLRTIYNVIGLKLTGTLKVCDGCACSKAKTRAVRKKSYTRLSQPGERIFVDTTGPFPDILIGNQYWIDVVDNCSHYFWIFFADTKLQFPKKIEKFSKKCHHVLHQLSTYVVTIRESANKNEEGV